ncbi:hypothetical protein [Streptomyces sp. E5N91]|uniref:hypothetical protein n=1 Tax=Streptomyces sp. E5N91 TaxID=1851996 RepID=UPI001EE7F7B8|nr:hypothetical protein [Streptomyces sp. E5N91]
MFRLAFFNEEDEAAAFRNEVTVGVRTRPDFGSPDSEAGDRPDLCTRPFGLLEAPIRLELLSLYKGAAQPPSCLPGVPRRR